MKINQSILILRLIHSLSMLRKLIMTQHPHKILKKQQIDVIEDNNL